MTFNIDRLNRLREDARMMRIYHDDHGIQEVIALCDAFEELQEERDATREYIAEINHIIGGAEALDDVQRVYRLPHEINERLACLAARRKQEATT